MTKRLVTMEAQQQRDFLTALPRELLSTIALCLFDWVVTLTTAEPYVWNFWPVSGGGGGGDEQSLFHTLQPYAVFALNRASRHILCAQQGHLHRVMVFEMIASGRVWIDADFYKRLMLPAALIWQRRELAGVMARSRFLTQVRDASALALRRASASLQTHFRAAVKAGATTGAREWLNYNAAIDDEEDSTEAVDWLWMALYTAQYAYLDECGCRFCRDRREWPAESKAWWRGCARDYRQSLSEMRQKSQWQTALEQAIARATGEKVRLC
jgi:hypothetical protein